MAKMSRAKTHEALIAIADFIAIKNLSRHNAEALVSVMLDRNLDFTPVNLEMVDKELYEDCERRTKLEGITRHVIEAWTADEFKKQMADPEVAKRIEQVLSEKGKKKGQEGQ
jgi:hypothetical protein